MSILDGAVLAQHVPTEVERIVSEVLDRIKHDPEVAHQIGSLLVEYVELDRAEALLLLEKQT